MAEETKVAAKKSNKGWIIGCAVGCGVALIILIIIIVMIFGWAGKKMDMTSYLTATASMYNTIQEQLKAPEKDSDLAAKKADFAKVKTTSDSDLKELNKIKPPKGAEQLQADYKEYFTLTGKMANGFVSIFDILASVQKVGDQFKSITIDNSSFTAQADSLRKLKSVLDPIVIQVDSMTVPSEIATTHNSVKTYFKNLSTGLDKAILGSDTKDGAVVTAAKTDMQTALDGIKNAFNIDNIYKTEGDRATALEKSIQDQTKSLSK